jgi:N4-gp56 family major capsid protein
MANETTSTTTANDQETLLQAKLLSRANLRLVAASICDKVQQDKGAGKSARFVRYERMDVPLVSISEGASLSYSPLTVSQISVTLDQWADVIAITDVAILTTKHPLVEEATKLLADNAQRVLDREVQVVWMAGTNVQYGDGSVTTRATITAAMKMTDTVIHKAVVTLKDGGAAPRGMSYVEPKGREASGSINGPKHYVAVCGPQVIHDIMAASTSIGTFASVAAYNSATMLYNAEVGSWLGLRWVETNFIPKFKMLGNTTTAVASTNAFGTNTPIVTAVDGGGSLTSGATYFYKVTRKKKSRGFEEDISIAHSTAAAATGNNESFTFNFSGLTAGYVYNLYFDTVAGGGTGTDATLGLHTANIAVGTTVTVTAAASATTTAPPNVNTTGTPTIHPVYVHGEESCAWVGLQNLEVMVSKDGPDGFATVNNPAKLIKTIAYKFMSKSVIKNQDYLIRCEVASSF